MRSSRLPSSDGPISPQTLALALALALWLPTACATRTETPTSSPAPTTAPGASTPSAASVKPGINKEFLNPDLHVDEWVGRFERDGRDIYDQRHELVKALGLTPGMRVADIGAGTGLFSALFAGEVEASGRVYAVDIAPKFIELIRKRAAEAGMANIVGVVCTERSTTLRASSIDRAFICDTYHHFEYPAATMASLHKALRKNGEIVVVDFHRIPGQSSDWTLDHVRAGQEVFTAEIEAAGFKKVEELPLLKENYVLRFRKVGPN